MTKSTKPAALPTSSTQIGQALKPSQAPITLPQGANGSPKPPTYEEHDAALTEIKRCQKALLDYEISSTKDKQELAALTKKNNKLRAALDRLGVTVAA